MLVRYPLPSKDGYHTFLGPVFTALPKLARYRWLITGWEGPALPENAGPGRCLMDGDALAALVTEEDPQWIWGCLLAFLPETPVEAILAHSIPNLETPAFWTAAELHHPLAVLELIAEDSSYSWLLTRSPLSEGHLPWL